MTRRFAMRTGAFALFLICAVPGGLRAETQDQEEVAISVLRDYLIVAPGSIGSLEKLNFLIDTGTIPTLVSRRLTQKLGISGPEVEIGIWGARTKVALVTLPVLQIGPVKVNKLAVFAIDMQPIEQELGMRLDAIIGLDALSKASFTVDYVRKVIAFGSPITTGMVVAMEFRDSPSPYVLVPAEIDGKQAHLLLDTGAGNLTLLDLRARVLGLPIKTPRWSANTASSGELIPLHIKRLRLGGNTVRVNSVFVRPVPKEALRDFDGMIGPTSLGIKRFTMNFQTKELYIELRK